MQAWFWCGYEYTASIVRAAPASAAFTSPTLLAATASSAVRPALSICATSLVHVLAFGRSPHSIDSASSAVLACHQVSATTATALSPTGTTFFTPGRLAITAASNDFTLPPNTGQS